MSIEKDGERLTPEQRSVVELPADACALVTAGAGAGKTHTLIRRLDLLVEEERLAPDEILVLTFSRAAVRELRERLGAIDSAARFVRARTFDSWALDLLRQVKAEEDWEKRSFRERIVRAREAIEEGAAEDLYGHDLRHVVIDEVQDLVGERRELVEVLLDEFDCGFTVVGDSAQYIYGFTVPDERERAGEADRFSTWLRNTFGDDLVEPRLTENFRARTPEARVALPYGARLQALSEGRADDGRKLFEELRDTLRMRAMDLGRLDELAFDALGSHSGTTAILCRTNGQALTTSGELAKGGVAHRLQRAATDRSVPGTIALLFRDGGGTLMKRNRFEELVSEAGLAPEEVDRLWRLLRRGGRARTGGEALDLAELRRAIAAGGLPDELTAPPPADLVVSSFHRAKGLEFDRVVVVDPGEPWGDGDHAEDARALYVAMTRPREELLWLPTEKWTSVLKDRAVGRWARYGPKGRRGRQRFGLEIDGRDVHTDHPAGARVVEGDPLALQEYLEREVRPGDEVALVRDTPVAFEPDMSPDYRVMHRGRAIGIVSDRFRRDLLRLVGRPGGRDPRWPVRITDVRVDTVETVVGSEAAGSRAGLGGHGVWSAPRLIGLGRFEWERDVMEEEAAVVQAR
ncbi:UvrD-helicase domain-containing protein [Nocardiopsis potens]|uniref:UvrD-helicase domain-containing protein n=1 Tax=Nocardiopsis potens TaxID=1246458 RepID=UPI000347358E|nr:UvrD-helicase domain-containing protein [Nocardiopsis potens]